MSKHKEHGTTRSYVIGFILSLIFTIIPYFLVVNKILTGSTLLVTILAIALLQMAIQLFFFLHLGRGPKPLYNVVFLFGTGGTIVIVVVASLFIMDNLYRTMTPKEVTIRIAQKENIAQINQTETGACVQNGASHVVSIENGRAEPSVITAKLCDTLTFANKDKKQRSIKFGDHYTEQSYGGEFEVLVDAEDSETITLNEAGEFGFHDGLDHSSSGSFSVNP